MNGPQPDPFRAYIGSQIAQYEPLVVHAPDRRGRLRQRIRYQKNKSGLNPLEAIAKAHDRDKVEAFRYAVALYIACSDLKMRSARWHQEAHHFAGVTECIGWQAVQDTGRSLGFSDERMKYLVDQLDGESSAVAGLGGSGEL